VPIVAKDEFIKINLKLIAARLISQPDTESKHPIIATGRLT
jgi:hypothetical protein